MATVDRSSEAKAPTSRMKCKDLSEEDNEDLTKLDGIFQRMKSSILPGPYILSTPSLHPYSHYSRHESQAWMLGRLFRPDEEHLQYRTFRYREPYQDCFVLQPDEEEPMEPERPKSQASDKSHQAPKKKISLSAYKSKQANGVITPGSKKVSPNLPPTKSAIHTNGVKKPESTHPSGEKTDPAKPKKRPATEALVSKKPDKRPRESADFTHSQSQPNSEPTESKSNVDRSAPSNSTPHGLPPLLSPVEQSVNNPYGLPDILSPTLPSNIQAELDKLAETQRKRGDSNASTSSSDRKPQLLPVPPAQKRDEGSKGPRIRSVSINGKSPDPPPVDKDAVAGPRLVVRLKYGKRNGTNVSQLLRLPPSRKPPPAPVDKKERPDPPKERPSKTTAVAADESSTRNKEASKTLPRRPDSSAPSIKVSNSVKVAEKRPRSESDTSSIMPAKRQKAQSSQDGPSTPAQQMATSPAISIKSSAQKNQNLYTTPRKEHRAVNMLRTTSAEGFDSTPARSGTTPSSTSKHLEVKGGASSAPLDKKKQAEIQTLSQVSMKLNTMGRSLKHEAQRIVTESGGHLSKEEQKRAAVTTLECILSYMAAYHAQDESMRARGRSGDVEGTWKTLLPLCSSFTRFTKGIPALDGLRLYLSAVISASICTQIAARSTRSKAHDSPQDLSQPELTKQFGTVTDNFALIADHHMKLLRYTRDAGNVLPPEDIQKLYPKTWSGKDSNSHFSRDPEKFQPGGRLSGPYYLPIQNDTTPIQAVRFGLKFLGEYGEKERLQYKLRVNLDKPE